MDTLYIVLPCYNESEVLDISNKKLLEKLNSLISQNKISKDSRILFVDDGSKDDTWQKISGYHEENKLFSGVKLSRNEGHQKALIAGMEVASKYADMIITMDADLQDDIDAIDEMLVKYGEGCEVVFGIRSSRKKDSFFKRFTAQSYYKLLNKMGCEIEYNHADFRLMSRRAALALLEHKEVELFIRGLVPLVGFKQGRVYFERAKRAAGESKYPLKKMLALAWNGITSLSFKPIKIIRSIGLLMLVLGFGGLAATITLACLKIISTSYITLSSVFFVGGIIVTSIGVVGEYVGKTYLESKHRPKYFIESVLNEGKNKDV